MNGPDTWAAVVTPLVARLSLAAALDMQFIHTPEGARALAKLVKGMADRLDEAVAKSLADPPP